MAPCNIPRRFRHSLRNFRTSVFRAGNAPEGLPEEEDKTTNGRRRKIPVHEETKRGVWRAEAKFSDKGRRSGAEGESREIPGGEADRDYLPMDTNPEYKFINIDY